MSTDHFRNIRYPTIVMIDIEDRAMLGVHGLSIGLWWASGVAGYLGVDGGFRFGDTKPVGGCEANATTSRDIGLIRSSNSRLNLFLVNGSGANEAQSEM